MKKFQLLLCVLIMILIASTVNAQGLRVVYATRFKTESPDLFKEAGLPEEMRQAMVQAYSHVTFSYQLNYKNGESEFRILPLKDKQEITFMGQKMDVNAMIQEQSQNVLYKNYHTRQLLNKTVFMGKCFLISDTLLLDSFEVQQGEVKRILDFECKKAVSADGKKVIWFTEHIPIADGPIACNLNGLILEAHDNQYVYTASQILEDENTQVAIPVGGKKVTNEAFQSLVQRQVERIKRGNTIMQ